MKRGVGGEGRTGDEEHRCRSDPAREAGDISASRHPKALLHEVEVTLVGKVPQATDWLQEAGERLTHLSLGHRHPQWNSRQHIMARLLPVLQESVVVQFFLNGP